MKANNIVHLTGRLGSDSEQKSFENGKGVVNFSIAVDNSYTNKDKEKVEQTNWFDIKLFSKAEATQKLSASLTKGKLVAVAGYLDQDVYEDNDGKKRTNTFVNVEDFRFLEKKD